MIIDYDHNPNLTYDQKLQSLKESVQMALNEFETNNATSVQNDTDANLAKTIIEDYTGSTLAGSSQSVKSAIDALDTSVDALDSAVDALDSTVDAIADFVVEQGTSGSWVYRKWNSGISECWAHFGTTSTSNGAWTTDFPSGLFVSTFAPYVVQTLWYGEPTDPSRSARAIIISDGSNSTQLVTYLRNYNGTVYSGDFAIQVHAKGRWE